MSSIQKEWLSFKNAAVPKDAPVTQVKDMQIAFYAGVLCTTKVVLEITADMTEDDAVNALEDLVTDAQTTLQQITNPSAKPH